MARTQKVTVEGDERLASTLRTAADRLEDLPATDASGRLVASSAASRAPVETGRLATSIQSAPASRDFVEIGSAVEYAAVTEFGGGNNIPAQPYLRPALTENYDVIVSEYAHDVNRVVDGIKGA